MTSDVIVAFGIVTTAAMTIVASRSWQQERGAARRRRRLVGASTRLRPIAATSGPGLGSASLALQMPRSGADARVARWLPGAAKLRDVLDRTGRSVSLSKYVGAMAIVAAVVFAVSLLAMRSGVAIPLILAVVAGVLLPRMYVRRLAKRRLAAFIRQFPDAIDLIVRALRAGLPLSEALVTVSQECPDPIGCEFRNAVGALAISRSVEDALWAIERTIDSAELRFFIISISTQIQTGGNLGETLGNLATILRQRSQMRIKVKAMTGEARASAGVLGSLPFVIGLLMSFTNPDYIAPLFADPRGWVMLGGGALMLTIGVGIMAKLVSFEI